MTIRVTIDIEIVETPRGRGVGVNVHTNVDPKSVPEIEGAIFVGLSRAINKYMRAHGAPTFDCLKEVKLDG